MNELPPSWLLALSDRLYRLLLAAYPADFRRAYGRHMAQVFRDCCRDAYVQHGWSGLIGWWLRTLLDLAVSALQEHLRGGNQMAFKRGFDIVFAFVSLLLLAPLLVALAIAIKLDSRGPVLYRDRRIGRGGRPFRMYKFRTMYTDAGRHGTPSPGERDPRVTRVGRYLRATMLDELPQYFNVLKGDMSLIGPRPAAPGELPPDDPDWQCVIAIRPGVSGSSQLAHGFGKADPRRTLELDLRYVQDRSTLLDLKLLLGTLRALMTR